MKKHINITISGKVHGVGFRFSCMEIAYKHNITGFVRNLKNGSVYIEAEGSEKNMQEFRAWCQKGPVWARIANVEEEEGELKNYDSFEINRKSP